MGTMVLVDTEICGLGFSSFIVHFCSWKYAEL